jgi:hypothetical protein
MTNVTTTTKSFGAPSSWSRPAGVSLVSAVVYPLSVTGCGAAKHAQKRFTMAATDIDVRPLGPQEVSSG